MSQVSRRSEVGNTKQRSFNTRLSSATSAGTFACPAGPYTKCWGEAGTKKEPNRYFVPDRKKGWKIDHHVSNIRFYWFRFRGVQVHPSQNIICRIRPYTTYNILYHYLSLLCCLRLIPHTYVSYLTCMCFVKPENIFLKRHILFNNILYWTTYFLQQHIYVFKQHIYVRTYVCHISFNNIYVILM